MAARTSSRRTFIGGLASAALVARARGALGASDPPVLTRRVEKLYTIDGCRQPNDLQFVPDGLWVLDQVDPNKAFKIHPRHGSIVQALQTESIHGSGITFGNGALWCVESDGRAIYKLDPRDGAPLARIQLTRDDPEPHGLDIDAGGVLWYCDAASGWICRLM